MKAGPRNTKIKKKRRHEDDPGLLRAVLTSEYDELDRQGKLRRVLQLRKERLKLIAEWQNAWAELDRCGKQTWTDQFAMRMLREGKSVQKNLQRHFDDLDRRRRKLTVRIRENIDEIVGLGGSVLTPMETPAIDVSKMSSIQSESGLGKNASTIAQFRDQIIRRYCRLSNEELCRRLDFELAQTEPPLAFPENWSKKYGVQNYTSAYRDPKCRNLVQKLISKAKQGL